MKEDQHIKIRHSVPHKVYIADGTIREFTYPFAIFENRDLAVYIDDERITEGYAVTGAGTSSGGSVTFEAPPAKDSTVTLRRQIAIERTSDFQTSGILRANVLNDELDRQTAIAQQLAADIGRAIKRPISSKATGDLSFPDPVPGRAIKFGDEGQMIVSEHDPDTFADAAAKAARKAKASEQAARDDRTATLAAKDEALASEQAAQQAKDEAQAAASSVGNPLDKTKNLADLSNKAAARTNLGVANLLDKMQNLADLPDKDAAKANLGILPSSLAFVGKYTQSTTVPLQANKRYCLVLVGGGGAGAGRVGGGGGGGGGGMSVYIEKTTSAVTARIAIGAGGTSTSNGPGGATTIHLGKKKRLWANGGQQGHLYFGGRGGNSAGMISISGSTGQSGGDRSAHTSSVGGSGGSGFFSGANGSSAARAGGMGGQGYGGGGGGSNPDFNKSARPGNGAPGIAFIWRVA